MNETNEQKKKKRSILGTILDGAKKVAEAAAETKREESKKRAWQRKDCGTPC